MKRRHLPQEHWRALVAEQQASGRAVRAFCHARGVPPTTFYKWRARLAMAYDRPAFVELRPVGRITPPAEAAIELAMANGRRVLLRPGFDPQTLGALLGVLDGRDGRGAPEEPA